jgi:hypothetical protein
MSIDASKEVGLQVNTEKTKYMLLSRDQNAGQNHDIKIANKLFQNVAQFKYQLTDYLYKKITQILFINKICKQKTHYAFSKYCKHEVQ